MAAAKPPENEDWRVVDEARKGSMCYSRWMMGHFARDFRLKGKGNGTGKDEGGKTQEATGETTQGTGKKGTSKLGGSAGEQKGWGCQGQCWTCRKFGHRGQLETEKDVEGGGVWVVGNVEEHE